jgi:hypothetical protein
MLTEAKIVKPGLVAELLREDDELTAILTSSRKTAKSNK